jgi:hypothetical protein
MLRGRPPKILTIKRQDIKGVELHLFILPARVQSVEVGKAINTENGSLAVDHEMLLSVLQRGFGDFQG